MFWATGQPGDGSSTYSEVEVQAWLKRTFMSNPATQSVVPNYANGLAVSGAVSPVSIDTGAAIVNGIPYENDAIVTQAVPTPPGAPTGHRIVLRADYSANTVRIALISSPNGVGTPPAVTQNASVWEVSLAALSITSGGVITVTVERSHVHYNTLVAANMLDSGSVGSDALAVDSVDDTKAGARVPQMYRRQGGDPVQWDDSGTTNYTPGAVRMQAGQIDMLIPNTGNSDTQVVTFPVPFSASPLLFATLRFIGLPPASNAITISPEAVGGSETTQFTIYARSQATVGSDLSFFVNWLAIGPE